MLNEASRQEILMHGTLVALQWKFEQDSTGVKSNDNIALQILANNDLYKELVNLIRDWFTMNLPFRLGVSANKDFKQIVYFSYPHEKGMRILAW